MAIASGLRTIAKGVGISALAISIPLVAAFEGRSLITYFDPVKIPTICYGETANVRIGQTMTPEECEALLRGRLKDAIATVDRLVTEPLTEPRRAALASFVYNAGEGAFAKSTMLQKLNAGDVRGACDELRRWVYAKGRKLGGLVKRREAERELCLIGS